MMRRVPTCNRGALCLAAVGAMALVFAPAIAGAEDWPCWRGPTRDGVVQGFRKPATWPKAMKKLWSVEVGEGHASPVVVGERVYLLSRQGENEVAQCVDLAGKLVWKKQYPAAYEVNSAAHAHGKGPKSTPAVAGGKLFTLGISGVLSAWSIDKGEKLWQGDFAQQFAKTSPLFGTAMSPIANDRVCVAHVGGHDRGAWTVFDAKTGDSLAAWTGDGPGYASPAPANWHETPQWVTQTQARCVGLSPDAKLLWSVPYTTEYHQNSVSPLVYQDLVIVSGYNRGLSAYRIEKSADRFAAVEAWRNPDVSLYMSSPVRVGAGLFCFSQRKAGQLCRVDVRTGKTVWQGPGRQGENAALLAAGDVLIALTTGADLQFLDAAADEHTLLANYRVSDSATWAHPVLLGRRVLIKDDTRLSLWSLE